MWNLLSLPKCDCQRIKGILKAYLITNFKMDKIICDWNTACYIMKTSTVHDTMAVQQRKVCSWDNLPTFWPNSYPAVNHCLTQVWFPIEICSLLGVMALVTACVCPAGIFMSSILNALQAHSSSHFCSLTLNKSLICSDCAISSHTTMVSCRSRPIRGYTIPFVGSGVGGYFNGKFFTPHFLIPSCCYMAMTSTSWSS